MPQSILCLALFIAQLFLILKGVNTFGKFVNPCLLLGVYLSLFALFLRAVRRTDRPAPASLPMRIAGAIVAAGALFYCFFAFQQLFWSFPDPVKNSDVIPQLAGQYSWFRKGEFPYRQMFLPQSSPFPVYMPLHWMAVGIARFIGKDDRWSGLLLMLPVFAGYGWLTVRRLPRPALRFVFLLLPASIFFSYVRWGGLDLAVSLETVIVAYYLVLALGLYSRNLPLTVTGIALCLLSRYTMIFWLPLFLALLYAAAGRTKAGLVCGVLLLAVLCFYVFPFVLKDPSIFMTGLRYHNGAAVGEWMYGAWSFEGGFYFAPHIRALTHEPVEHQVFVARVLQGGTMFGLLAGGLLYFRRQRNRINFYDFSLGMLWLFVVLFYTIGPLTYRYYLVVPLALSCLVCQRIMEGSLMRNRELVTA